MVTGPETGNAGANLIDHTDALVAEDTPQRAGRNVAFEDVQIGAADSRFINTDDSITRFADLGDRLLFERLLSWPLINKRFIRAPHAGCN